MKNKGITLIALVITIIVLLILAGISISMLSGNNSILSRSEQARNNTIEEQEKEQVKLAYISAFTNNSGGKVSKKNLQDELDVNVWKDKTEVTGKETLKVKFEDTQNCYKITKNGQVTKDTSGNIPDDIFVALYNDGTLVFSNNEASIDTTKVSKSYGNIKGKDSDWYPEWAENDMDNINKVEILNEIKPTNTSNWFEGLYNLTELNVERINTENVTDMSGMFSCCAGLTSIDVSSFDTSNVTDMSGMFYMDDDFAANGFTCLNRIIGLNSFDTTKTTDMNRMFKNCQITELDLSTFDTRNVETIEGMFLECNKLVTIYASNWNTSSIIYTHNYEKNIFNGCTSLVGEKGTTYDSSKTSCDYAHIDGGTSNPGYFTTPGYFTEFN